MFWHPDFLSRLSASRQQLLNCFLQFIYRREKEVLQVVSVFSLIERRRKKNKHPHFKELIKTVILLVVK